MSRITHTLFQILSGTDKVPLSQDPGIFEIGYLKDLGAISCTSNNMNPLEIVNYTNPELSDHQTYTDGL